MTLASVAARMAEAHRRRRRRLLDVGLARPAGRGRGRRPAAQALVHPAVDERRPQPDGHLRPQARPPQRRPLPGNRHVGPRNQDQRAPAADRQARRRNGDRPLDVHQGGRPRPGDVPDAHRPAAQRADPVPVARLAGRQGNGARRRGAAGLRQHRPVPLLQLGGLRPRLSRPAVRSADRRRERQLPRPAGRRERPRRGAEGAGPRPRRRRGRQAGGGPGAAARRNGRRLPGRALRRPRAQPPHAPTGGPSR